MVGFMDELEVRDTLSVPKYLKNQNDQQFNIFLNGEKAILF
jgi:hypothetical protein